MTREKIYNFWKNQFRINIFEISLSGIFVALWIISDRFITIDFGIMRAGLVYVWAILIGLTNKPILAVLTAIIADNLALAIKGGFGYWMIEYAIIYPGITLFASLFKQTFKIKNDKLWWTIMILINTITIGGAFVFMLVKNDFVSHSQNSEANLDFTDPIAKIAIWICMVIMFLMFSYLAFKTFKNRKYREYLAIYSLVAATIILFIWVWGPIAQVRYLIRLSGQTSSGNSYWSLYDVYLTARVLKTPIILPIYSLIIGSVYHAYLVFNVEHKRQNQW